MAISIALQLYSVRNELIKDFVGTLEKVKNIGYDSIELAGLCGKNALEVKETLEQIGLTPVSAHVSLEDILENPQQIMEIYSNIGVRYMAIPYLQEKCRPKSGNFSKTLSDIVFACEQANEYGITMLYHNHHFEFDILDGEYYLDTIYKSIPAVLLQTEIDTCWVNVAGEDPAAYIMKYKGRAPIVHLKDFTMKNRANKENLYELIGIQSTADVNYKEDFSLCPVGYGVQDVSKILQAAEAAEASWVVVEQDHPASVVFSMVSDSFKKDVVEQMVSDSLKKVGGQTELESVLLSREYLKTLGY